MYSRDGYGALVRILVAPDDFKGSMSAAAAAYAIERGWHRTAPDDVIDLCPMSDGGPGFVDTLHTALGGDLLATGVSGPLGESVPGAVLFVDETAYVEAAHACGLALLPVPPELRDPTITATIGVGQLLLVARDAGAKRIVVGIGGTGTNDAGAGMLAALGSQADGALDRGGLALRGITFADLQPARQALAGVELVVATDVDIPLLGLTGATNTFAAQKGASESDVMALEGALSSFAAVVGRTSNGKDPAVAMGAGAGGGLGYALLHLGAARVSGIGAVIEAVGLIERISQCDVVVTGEGRFDWSSLRGKVCSGVARAALEQGRPCVVLAGDVIVGKREYCAIGVTEAHSLVEFTGSTESAIQDAEPMLVELAARVAQSWSRRR